MQGMPGMQGMSLVLDFCHRKAGLQVPGRRHGVCKYGWFGLLLVCDSVQEGCAVVGLL